MGGRARDAGGLLRGRLSAHVPMPHARGLRGRGGRGAGGTHSAFLPRPGRSAARQPAEGCNCRLNARRNLVHHLSRIKTKPGPPLASRVFCWRREGRRCECLAHFDAADFLRIGRLLGRLPADMQAIAFRRAAGRTKSVVERNYARFASQHVKVAQKLIKARMRSSLSAGDVTLIVKSGFIRSTRSRARQQGYGVHVRGRGRYEGAFIPAASAKRARGYVLKRDGASRLPTHMLFGPNPAHAVQRTPKEYEDMLAEIARGEFQKTILQQVAYLLSGSDRPRPPGRRGTSATPPPGSGTVPPQTQSPRPAAADLGSGRVE